MTDFSESKKGRWLTRHFGDAVATSGDDGATLRMPQMYRYAHARELSMADVLTLLFNRSARFEVRLVPVEVRALSMEKGIDALYSLVAQGCVLRDLYLYAPKPGQTEDVIDLGKSYPVIKRHDPLHSHDDAPHLIDFLGVEIVRGRVMKGSMKGDHSHLLIT